eukprot:2958556-Rhodomonas_salina.2
MAVHGEDSKHWLGLFLQLPWRRRSSSARSSSEIPRNCSFVWHEPQEDLLLILDPNQLDQPSAATLRVPILSVVLLCLVFLVLELENDEAAFSSVDGTSRLNF